MELNFENDFSLFMGVSIPGQLEYPGILEWFRSNNDSTYRLIFDSEFHEENIDFKTCSLIYDDIKTFSVVSNPWARVKLVYMMILQESNRKAYPEFTFMFNLENFEQFVLNWPTSPSPTQWFSMSMPQVNWVQYTDTDGTLKKVDYLIKQENLKEDFEPFQKYFFNNHEYKIKHIDIYNKMYDYRLDYTDQMKTHIGKMFEEDVDTFKYSF